MIRRALARLVRGSAPAGERPVLVTGGAGTVATLIRPFLAGVGIRVRLSDVNRVRDLAPTESFVKADLRDPRAIGRAVAGCAGVIHLGGISKDWAFTQLVDVDMAGVTNVLEAARRHGIKRVVLASSMHVLGFYGRQEAVSPSSAPRPDSRYAVSKLFGEHAGALYASKYGLEVTCLRLGHVTLRREDAEPGGWVSPEDVASLVRLGLEHPSIGYEIIHAVAPYEGDDLAHQALASRFGFRFKYQGTTHAEAVADAARHFAFDQAAVEWRGGVFATRDVEPA